MCEMKIARQILAENRNFLRSLPGYYSSSIDVYTGYINVYINQVSTSQESGYPDNLSIVINGDTHVCQVNYLHGFGQ